MTTLYPWGYSKRLVDEQELFRLARIDQMDPGYARRLRAWIVSRGGHIGIGGAFRTIQPDQPGFAPAGQSFHQLQKFSDAGYSFMAVDLVARNGDNVHRSPRWDEVPRQSSGHQDISTYGVHCNVSGEPWHMQAIEVDGWGTWVNLGRKRPNPNFQLPNVEPSPPPPPPPPPPPTPPNTGVITVQFTSRYLVEGASGNDVVWLQNHLNFYAKQNLSVDGQFGPGTKTAVLNWQRFFGLTVDGEAGEQTQRSIIEIALAVG